MGKTIIIIGAGIAGLSAGCYGQMNGYHTQIFEMHDKPGGLCTAWKRRGYTFDGCIHSIGGLNPRYKLYHYWNELVSMEKLKFFYYDELARIEDSDGNAVRVFTDPDKLEQELISIAPEDGRFINSFITAVKKLPSHDMQLAKPLELWSPVDYYLSQFRTAPIMKHLFKWRKSVADMTKKCKSPLLKYLLNSEFFSRYPAYFLIYGLGHLHNMNAGYPIGGSLAFSSLLEKRYLDLGGQIHYKAKVAKVNVINNRAIGITLESGETHDENGIVVSAADGHYTVFEMLGGRYINQEIRKLYDDHPIWPSAVIVYLGVSRTFDKEPPVIELSLKKALVVDERSRLDRLPVTIYNFDPTLAPEGKTCIRVILQPADYRYWHDLRNRDRQKYKQDKARIANEVIRVLEQRLGNIEDNLEVTDVVTPATFKRYTNNWQGSIQGWEWLPRLIPESMRKELPGLRNFYMVGQWVEPGGGVPTAFISGRNLIQIICKRDKKKFATKLPAKY